VADGHGRVAALQWRDLWDPTTSFVVLIPDSGRGYLSKLYNDGWMADFGFLRSVVNRWVR